MLHVLLRLLAATSVCAASLRVLNSTTLGPDPATVNRLNGESFQQDALVIFQGWQYAVHYLTDAANASVRHPAVSRRKLAAGAWETFTLEDYDQTEDDGHDMCVFAPPATEEAYLRLESQSVYRKAMVRSIWGMTSTITT